MKFDRTLEGVKKVRSHSSPKVNLSEIAKRANVSTATASRAINRIPTVDPRLAKRVRSCGETWLLPEHTSTSACFRTSGRSRIFGIIVPGIADPFCREMLDAFENVAQRHDYDILLMSTVYDAEHLGYCRMVERRVDAIAIWAVAIERSVIEHFGYYVLLVLVDSDRTNPAAVIGLDNIRLSQFSILPLTTVQLSASIWQHSSLTHSSVSLCISKSRG